MTRKEDYFYEYEYWHPLVSGIEKFILECDIEGVSIELVNCKNINEEASFKTSLLIMAVRTKCEPIILLLLKSGADPRLEDNCRYTPLEVAITLECFNIVALLLQYGANGKKYLLDACLYNDIELATVLLQNGVSANIVDTSGNSLLISAVCNDNIDIVSLLLYYGANINYANNIDYGYTSLMIACMNGSINIVSLLLIHGAKTDTKSQFGATAWDYINCVPEKSEELRKLFVICPRISFLSLFECCSNDNEQNNDIIRRYLFDAMIVRELCSFL
jgi:ankyrin repeat protein